MKMYKYNLYSVNTSGGYLSPSLPFITGDNVKIIFIHFSMTANSWLLKI